MRRLHMLFSGAEVVLCGDSSIVRVFDRASYPCSSIRRVIHAAVSATPLSDN